MRTRRSPRNQQALYKAIGRQLASAAAASSAPASAHQHAYLPEVDGLGLKTGVTSCACGDWKSGAEDEGLYVEGNRVGGPAPEGYEADSDIWACPNGPYCQDPECVAEAARRRAAVAP